MAQPTAPDQSSPANPTIQPGTATQNQSGTTPQVTNQNLPAQVEPQAGSADKLNLPTSSVTVPSNPVQAAKQAATNIQGQGAEAKLSFVEKIKMKLNLAWHKIVAILLTIQGLYGILKSVQFVIIDYPKLEEALLAHQISQNEVNNLANSAILIVLSTVLSMFFAIKLAALQSKIARRIFSAIGIALFLANSWLHQYFNQIGLGQTISEYYLQIVRIITQPLRE